MMPQMKNHGMPLTDLVSTSYWKVDHLLQKDQKQRGG